MNYSPATARCTPWILCVLSLALLIPLPALALLPFDKTGNLFVSMWTADEIAVFAPDGTPISRFSADGLDGPRGIAFNPANGEIWVAGEFSNAIYIFDHQQNFLRTLEHPDFDEPVGISFTALPDLDANAQEVYVSNSNGNEIMVFDQQGSLQQRFTETNLQDPNCTAFMQDSSLFVANRLGGSSDSLGAVSRFDANDTFEFDFTTTGISSLMAIARDPNSDPAAFDDTIWVTSGGGDTGIYEFDPNGNLLTTRLPADIDGGTQLVPQGIAFSDDGHFFVISMLGEVLEFDGDGNFLSRFPTGSGTPRSTAFQGCESGTPDADLCVPLGAGDETIDGSDEMRSSDVSSGRIGGYFVGFMLLLLIVRVRALSIVRI